MGPQCTLEMDISLRSIGAVLHSRVLIGSGSLVCGHLPGSRRGAVLSGGSEVRQERKTLTVTGICTIPCKRDRHVGAPVGWRPTPNVVEPSPRGLTERNDFSRSPGFSSVWKNSIMCSRHIGGKVAALTLNVFTAHSARFSFCLIFLL